MGEVEVIDGYGCMDGIGYGDGIALTRRNGDGHGYNTCYGHGYGASSGHGECRPVNGDGYGDVEGFSYPLDDR